MAVWWRSKRGCERTLAGPSVITSRASSDGTHFVSWGRFGFVRDWHSGGETFITGMVLSILSYFEHDDPRLGEIAARLLEEQMPDGGWICRRPRGATHASMHTTIGVLEGLRDYERRGRKLRAYVQRNAAPASSFSYFELERIGAPSRWNTLRALRVLKWWDERAR